MGSCRCPCPAVFQWGRCGRLSSLARPYPHWASVCGCVQSRLCVRATPGPLQGIFWPLRWFHVFEASDRSAPYPLQSQRPGRGRSGGSGSSVPPPPFAWAVPRGPGPGAPSEHPGISRLYTSTCLLKLLRAFRSTLIVSLWDCLSHTGPRRPDTVPPAHIQSTPWKAEEIKTCV